MLQHMACSCSHSFVVPTLHMHAPVMADVMWHEMACNACRYCSGEGFRRHKGLARSSSLPDAVVVPQFAGPEASGTPLLDLHALHRFCSGEAAIRGGASRLRDSFCRTCCEFGVTEAAFGSFWTWSTACVMMSQQLLKCITQFHSTSLDEFLNRSRP